ncbi:hypothetical protein KDD30_16840 (plasmid) [Photobacterium sp. GJ3]|uniref:hypothetical protein n=1 Tax=Photobacterium sp. GJ3 TaxID=2829502 RepID=UPI001B8C55B5|nr:hypothetical protein [Photobacterium sp. GJ3]QUJ69840.1 hypothetical protein KDD30_16840 [Photobacterium sp. GJ3]
MITASLDRQTDLFCSKNVRDLALWKDYDVTRSKYCGVTFLIGEGLFINLTGERCAFSILFCVKVVAVTASFVIEGTLDSFIATTQAVDHMFKR